MNTKVRVVVLVPSDQSWPGSQVLKANLRRARQWMNSIVGQQVWNFTVHTSYSPLTVAGLKSGRSNPPGIFFEPELWLPKRMDICDPVVYSLLAVGEGVAGGIYGPDQWGCTGFPRMAGSGVATAALSGMPIPPGLPAWANEPKEYIGGWIHELGHCLGLGHTPDYEEYTTPSVMWEWWRWPDVGLTEREKEILRTSL